MKKNELSEEIAKIIKENITFSGQIGDYVIHGAIEKIQELMDRQNESRRKSLEELIPIAEWLKSEYPIDFYLYFKESAIERAKKLI